MLSPRLATYRALPGGATAVSAGSGALGAVAVEGLEVSSSFGLRCLRGGDRSSLQRKPKEMNKMLASEATRARGGAKCSPCKPLFSRMLSSTQTSGPDNVGPVLWQFRRKS